MSDEIYDEGLQEDIFDEKWGWGHPVLVSINNELEYAGIENKD